MSSSTEATGAATGKSTGNRAEAPVRRTGGCLCGAIRFTTVLAKSNYEACHCGKCRRWGGPLMSIKALEVEWEDASLVRSFASSKWAERGFCGRCGSNLYFKLTAKVAAEGAGAGQMYLAVGTLDDQRGLMLTHEIFTDRRPEGYCFAGELEGMTEAEVLASLTSLPEYDANDA